MVHEGGCLCGAVRFKADGEPINVRCCHCRACQLAMGSPFYARAQFLLSDVSIAGPTAAWPTSDRIERVFCTQCGTRMFSRRRDGSQTGIALACFDDRNAFVPTLHHWRGESPDWLKLGDGLPEYQGQAPA
jgi:hypothetical protein